MDNESMEAKRKRLLDRLAAEEAREGSRRGAKKSPSRTTPHSNGDAHTPENPNQATVSAARKLLLGCFGLLLVLGAAAYLWPEKELTDFEKVAGRRPYVRKLNHNIPTPVLLVLEKANEPAEVKIEWCGPLIESNLFGDAWMVFVKYAVGYPMTGYAKHHERIIFRTDSDGHLLKIVDAVDASNL